VSGSRSLWTESTSSSKHAPLLPAPPVRTASSSTRTVTVPTGTTTDSRRRTHWLSVDRFSTPYRRSSVAAPPPSRHCRRTRPVSLAIVCMRQHAQHDGRADLPAGEQRVVLADRARGERAATREVGARRGARRGDDEAVGDVRPADRRPGLERGFASRSYRCCPTISSNSVSADSAVVVPPVATSLSCAVTASLAVVAGSAAINRFCASRRSSAPRRSG
jgi:hypothetical protein